MADTVRAFVAVDVDARLRQQVARVQNALGPAVSGAKWVEPRLCHLTLKFLGYVPEPQLGDIAAACRRAAGGNRPFELRFRGIGGFPRLRGARVLWMGLEHGEAPLRELQAALERELVPLGFPPEDRPFSPHLTLARFKASARLEDLAQPFERQRFGTVPIAGVQLMRSVLSPKGPEYTVLESFALG